MTASRTRRTASALWRCAGQATTLSEPGQNKAECAIAQAAVVVLPPWRAVSARIEAPRGALKKFLLPACGFDTKNLAHPQRRIEPISDLTQMAHRPSPKTLVRSAPSFQVHDQISCSNV